MGVLLQALFQPANDLWVAGELLLMQVFNHRGWHQVLLSSIGTIESGIEGVVVLGGFLNVVQPLEFLLKVLIHPVLGLIWSSYFLRAENGWHPCRFLPLMEILGRPRHLRVHHQPLVQLAPWGWRGRSLGASLEDGGR